VITGGHSEFRVDVSWGLEFGVEGLEVGVWGLGLGGSGFGFGGYGVGFGVSRYRVTSLIRNCSLP